MCFITASGQYTHSPGSLTRISHQDLSPGSLTRISHQDLSPGSLTRISHQDLSPGSLTRILCEYSLLTKIHIRQKNESVVWSYIHVTLAGNMWWLLWMIVSVTANYHSTETLLKQVQQHCHGPLTCRFEGNVLLADWSLSNATKRVFLVFNEHARERVTGELALRVVERLHEWQPRVNVTIVPVLNVWGRKRVEAGHPCLRKNEHGVDPNRNYQMPVNRHHYSRSSEEYEGRAPLSETTSKLVVRELANTDRYVNVHSGEFSLYMAYDSRTRRPPNWRRMHEKLNEWRKWCPKCAVGAAAKTSFYKAYGTSVDWAVDHGVPEAYTFEIYGKNVFDCAMMFNPTASHLETHLDRWAPILKNVLEF